MNQLSPAAHALLVGHHADPFNFLGPHYEGDQPVVRVFMPDATHVTVVFENGEESELPPVHESGLFAGPVARHDRRYRLRVRFDDNTVEMEDTYTASSRSSPTSTCTCSTKARICSSTTKLGAHPIVRLRGRRRIRRSMPRMRAASA